MGMGPKVIWVLPNVAQFNKNGRGSFQERYYEAKKLNFDAIEIPADFIKNPTEVKLTGLLIGDVLTREAISKLYKKPSRRISIKYILHTDPQARRDSKLKWYNPEWRRKFIEMLNNLIEYFEMEPYAIEIHPGTKPNSIKNITSAMVELTEEFPRTKILIENRTHQLITDAFSMNKLWNMLRQEYPNIVESGRVGIVLDVQQLFTQTGKNRILLQRHLQIIEPEAIFGVHIHSGSRGHHTPSLKDPIPWIDVAKFLNNSLKNKEEFLINPEVHTKSEIQATRLFIERNLLSL